MKRIILSERQLNKILKEEEYSQIKCIATLDAPEKAQIYAAKIRNSMGLDKFSCYAEGRNVFMEVENDRYSKYSPDEIFKAAQELGSKKDYKKAISESRPGFQVNRPLTVFDNPKPQQAQNTGLEQQASQSQVDNEEHDDAYYDKVELFKDPKLRSGKDWAKNGGNFAIKRNGKIYYVSRSTTVSLYAFCQDKFGNWCMLANQRGPGCTTGKWQWNAPAGFLDEGETAEEAAARETFEETGVEIPIKYIKQMGVNTHSHNVRIRFSCVLPGLIDDYPTSDEYCEPGEVSDIKWIPVLDAKGKPSKELYKYRWVRNPNDMVAQAETMLSHLWDPDGNEYKKFNNPKDRLIWHLKNEIRNNPRANLLLDKLLQNYTK